MVQRFLVSACLSFCLVFGVVEAGFAGEIHRAVMQNNTTKVNELLKKDKTLVNSKDRNQYTPLFWALNYGRPKMATLLINAGAKCDTYCRYTTPLHMCISQNQTAVLDLMLKQKPKLDVKDSSGYTPLMYAVQYNRKTMAGKLMKAGADPTVKNNNGQNAFAFAMQYGSANLELAKQMLAHKGITVNQKDRYGNTALTHAVNRGDKKMIEFLISKGADPTFVNKSGQNLLHYACMNYYQGRQAIPILLKYKKIEVNKQDRNGYTPLIYFSQRYYQRTEAAQKATYEQATALIKAGADPNLAPKNNVAYTPLYAALAQRNFPCALACLEGGAKVKKADKNGITPLHLACYSPNPPYYYRPPNQKEKISVMQEKLVALLIKKGADADAKTKNKPQSTPLQIAVANNSLGAVNSLIPHVKDINVNPNSGQNLFHWACENGLDKAVGSLLKRKADASKKDKKGRTPLFLACENGHAKVAKILLDAKQDPNQKDAEGQTLLIAASWNNHAPVVEALITAGAKIDVKDESGYSALHAAAWNGNNDLVKALIKAKADVNVSRKGYTPLHSASWKGHSTVVQTLITAGAKTNVKDRDGMTPVHRAAWNGHTAVLQALGKAGANLSAKDNDGYTALDKAEEQNKTAAIAWLKAQGVKPGKSGG